MFEKKKYEAPQMHIAGLDMQDIVTASPVSFNDGIAVEWDQAKWGELQ